MKLQDKLTALQIENDRLRRAIERHQKSVGFSEAEVNRQIRAALSKKASTPDGRLWATIVKR